jgi:hypothetical protein
LILHAYNHLLQVEISGVVPELIIDLLEIVEVDIKQSKDACRLSRCFNGNLDLSFERESVMDAGEQIELRAVYKIGVEPRGLDCQPVSTARGLVWPPKAAKMTPSAGPERAGIGSSTTRSPAREFCDRELPNVTPSFT